MNTYLQINLRSDMLSNYFGMMSHQGLPYSIALLSLFKLSVPKKVVVLSHILSACHPLCQEEK